MCVRNDINTTGCGFLTDATCHYAMLSRESGRCQGGVFFASVETVRRFHLGEDNERRFRAEKERSPDPLFTATKPTTTGRGRPRLPRVRLGSGSPHQWKPRGRRRHLPGCISQTPPEPSIFGRHPLFGRLPGLAGTGPRAGRGLEDEADAAVLDGADVFVERPPLVGDDGHVADRGELAGNPLAPERRNV